MGDNSAQQPADDTGQAARSPLPSGARVGPYTVVRLLKTTDAEYTYVARAEADIARTGERPPDGASAVFHLVERAAGGHDGVRPLLALGLRHPHLLVPRDIIAQDAHEYLVVEAVEESAPAEARPPLDAAGALAVGAGLADALSYLHQTGVAHLRVSPALVVVQDGHGWLAGVEEAQLIHPLDPQAPPLFARDANFLARTLGVLAGITDVDTAAGRGDPATAALAAIVERGAASGFATAQDVGMACSAALPRREQSAVRFAAPAASGRISFSVAIASSVGRQRTENQDAGACSVCDVRDDVGGGVGGALPAGVFLVADGMGGEERGELASRITARIVVAETMRQLVLPVMQTPVEAALAGLASADAVPPGPVEALLNAGRAANTQVRKLAAILGKATGTTLTAMAAIGARAALIHIGDSRAYLLRAGQLAQLTEDHTILARLQAMDHPLLHDPAFAVPRNYLYRSIGQEDDPEFDALELTLAPGDRVLLCSDGLWDEVDPAALLAMLLEAPTPQECANTLVAAADAGGGHDNSTAVVVFVGDSAPAAGSAAGSGA
jgi:serine/threonine protein phosphatase PrpC